MTNHPILVFGFTLIIIVSVSSALSLSRRLVDESILQEAHVDNGFSFHSHSKSKRSLPSDAFKVKYVLLGGIVSTTPDSNGFSIEVAVTNSISDVALTWAANVVAKQTRFMPVAIFNHMCLGSSVGIFTGDDGLTVYPEYASLRSTPQCTGLCSGDCARYCTGDGRPYSSIAGLGGSRAVDLYDNLMCTSKDPYFGTLSGLVHEVSHTAHRYGVNGAVPEYMTKILSAYESAKANGTWDTSSYAMSSVYEYFAVAATAFFNAATSPSVVSGRMNSCGQESGTCSTEKQARAWLKHQDPVLFDIISYVFTNRRTPSLFLGGISICPPNSADNNDNGGI